jgi:hypothetical protein
MNCTGYEPFDGAGYIPDFLIHGDRPLIVEVKPAVTKAQYEEPIAKIETGLATVWDGDVLIVGADPLPLGNPGYRRRKLDTWSHPTVGLIGQFVPECGQPHDHEQQWEQCDRTVPDWWWAEGHWFTCGTCGQPGLFSSLHSVMFTCGHNESMTGFAAGAIATFWAKACNAVKWRGAATTEPVDFRVLFSALFTEPQPPETEAQNGTRHEHHNRRS